MNFTLWKAAGAAAVRLALIPIAAVATIATGFAVWLAYRQRVSALRATLAVALICLGIAGFIPLVWALEDPSPEAPIMIWSLRHLGDIPAFAVGWAAFQGHEVLGALAFVITPLALLMAALLLNWPHPVSRPVRRVAFSAWAFVALAAFGSLIARVIDIPWAAAGWLGAGLAASLGGLVGAPAALAISTLGLAFFLGGVLDLQWASLGRHAAQATRQAVLSADRVASRGVLELKRASSAPLSRTRRWLDGAHPRMAKAIKALDTPLPRAATALDYSPATAAAPADALIARLAATRASLRQTTQRADRRG